MTTSVCMGTYNGENYIEEQLYSILHQTKVPDEVIICDDCSNDGTVAVIEKFIAENHLENSWRLYQNQENKGYPANFYYAMSLCTMDVVFLSDQDDVWDVKKLERMCAVLDNQPKIKAVCCKFGLIDAQGQNIQTIMAPTRNKGTGNLRTVTIEDVFYKCEWPGMVVAYRNGWYRSWREKRKQDMGMEADAFTTKIPHDFLICARAAEENGFLQMDEELAYHRRHDNNAGGEEHRLRKLLNKQRKLKEIEDYLRILGAFRNEVVLNTPEGENALTEKYQAMRGRCEALQSGKLMNVIKMVLHNKKQVRIATVICDILIVKQ